MGSRRALRYLQGPCPLDDRAVYKTPGDLNSTKLLHHYQSPKFIPGFLRAHTFLCAYVFDFTVRWRPLPLSQRWKNSTLFGAQFNNINVIVTMVRILNLSSLYLNCKGTLALCPSSAEVCRSSQKMKEALLPSLQHRGTTQDSVSYAPEEQRKEDVLFSPLLSAMMGKKSNLKKKNYRKGEK